MRALLAARWPALPLDAVRYLAEGWDSQVFEVGGSWLFRFPKRAEVERDFVVEAALLPPLAAHLARHDAGVRIPCFDFLGQACELFPYRFVGYRKIPGRQGSDVDADQLAGEPLARIARQLGRALTALHAFPVERAFELGVPMDMPSRRVSVMRDRALTRLPQVAVQLGRELAEEVEAGLRSAQPEEYAGDLVLVHNDLSQEHLILEPEAPVLAGIIDWSDAGVGDPAVDFVGVHAWGGSALVDRVLADYGGTLGAGARERIRYRTLCLGVFGAVHANATGVEGEMEWSRGVLRRALPALAQARA